VIDRLANPQLQWVLRYGVIPRRLDLGFLEAVMAPHLGRAMAGAPTGDDPRTGIEGIATRNPIFSTNLLSSPDEVIVTRALWEELERYAGASSWVSAGEEPGTLSFHPEVRVPMRDLLRGQSIFAALHRDAAAHFERRAAAEPAARIGHLCDAVYHWCQRDGDGAALSWRALLGSEVGDDPVARRSLALEVLGPELLGEDGYPRRLADGTAMLPVELVLAARWEHARAAAEIAWKATEQSGRALEDAVWAEAWRAIDDAERLESESSLGDVAPAAKALALCYRERTKGSAVGPSLRVAGAFLERALAPEAVVCDRDRLRIVRELAGLLMAVQPEAARRHYNAALSLAQTLGVEAGVDAEIHMRAADAVVRLGDNAAAIDHLRAALDGLEAAKSDDAMIRETVTVVALRLAEAELRAGRPAEAFELVKGPRVDQIRWNPRRNTLAAWACLALGDPGGAIIETAILDDGTPMPDAERARLVEWRGEALIELHEITAAKAALEQARALWDQLGSRGDANRCMRRRIEAILRITGDIREADEALTALERGVDSSLPDDLRATRLLRAKLLAQRSEDSSARDILVELARDRGTTSDAALDLGITLACLSNGAGDAEEHWAALVQALKRTTSPWERLHRLLAAGPASIAVPPPSSVAELLVEPWRRLLSEPIRLLDARYLTLGSARVLAGLGLRDPARRFFDEASAIIRGATLGPDLANAHSFVKSELLRLAWRLEIETIDEDDLLLSVAREYEQHRLLVGALKVEQGESLLRRSPLSAALEDVVRRADEWLQAGSSNTQWHARLHALEAQLEVNRGNRGYTNQRAGQGMSILRELGHRANTTLTRGLEAFQAFSGPSPLESFSPMGEPGDDRLVVRIDRAGHAFEIRLQDTRMGLPTHTLERIDPEEPIPESPWTSEGFVSSVVQSGSFNLQLESLLHAPEIADRLMLGPAVDICLEIAPRAVPALPWESAAIPGGPRREHLGVRHLYRGAPRPERDAAQIRWLQAGLNEVLGSDLTIDALWGPKTESAVRDFQSKHHLPVTGQDDQVTRLHLARIKRRVAGMRPIALILVPNARRSRSMSRNFSKVADLRYLYDDRGFSAVPVEDPTVEKLARLNLAIPPDVIHVSAGLVDMGQELALDFAIGYGERSEDSRPFSAEALRGYLREHLPPGAPRPLVIVDVPRPGSPGEMVRQILLRNHFTADLFAESGVSALLGTMLEAQEVDQLTAGLAEGQTPGALVEAIRRSKVVAAGDTLRLASTALFTFNPTEQAILRARHADS
jgi:cellulose synthase operon protein C